MSAALAPLRYPPFRYLVAGRVVSMFGNAMAPIALAFAVLDLTGSVTALGVVVAVRSVMTVLFLLFGGVVADRLPRQLVAVASGLLAGVAQAGAATLVLTHTASVPLLAGLGAVNGLAASFSFPALAALVAQTVPAPIRKQANALHRLGVNTAMIVGASVGGLLVAPYGPGWGLAVDAASFFVAAGCYALVRIPPLPRADSGTSTLAELREG
jgi:MFS family permease